MFMIKKFLFFFLFVFLFLFIGTNKARAQEKSYTISPVNINLEILKDGSMKVFESRTFNFNGSFTFAYEYINKKGKEGVSTGRVDPYILEDFELCEDSYCYKKVTASAESQAPSQRANSFYVVEEEDRYYIKWFYQATDESKTFTLKYRVKNAVTLHEDIAEVYWKVIGDD